MALCITVPAICTGSDRRWPEYEFHEIQYTLLMQRHSTNLQNHVELFDAHRLMYQPICPPGMNTFTQEGFFAETSFESDKFPSSFVSGLVSQNVDGVTAYPLYIYDDGLTNRYYFNANTQSLGYVDNSMTYHSDTQSYEPIDVVVTYDCMSKEECTELVWLKPMAPNGASQATAEPETFEIMYIDPAGDSNVIEIGYTETFRTSYTDINIYSTTNLIATPNLVWMLEAVVQVSTEEGQNTVWTDTDVSGAVISYACGNRDIDDDEDGMSDDWEFFMNVSDATADPDGDGLSNLGEFLNQSDPNIVDTDGDGISDAIEYAELVIFTPLE